jgi:hypothetical protein
VNRYANHRGAKNAAVKYVSRLKDLQDRAVLVLDGFGAVHRLVEMRIEGLAKRVDALDPEAREVIDELLVDQLEAFTIIFVLGFAMSRQSMLETVDNGDESFDDAGGMALGVFGALFFDALAVVIEIGLAAHQRLAQLVEIAGELGYFGIGGCGICCEFGLFNLVGGAALRAALGIEWGILV